MYLSESYYSTSSETRIFTIRFQAPEITEDSAVEPEPAIPSEAQEESQNKVNS